MRGDALRPRNGAMAVATSIVIAIAIAAAGCATTSGTQVTLVRLKPDPMRIRLTAALEGALVIRHGCVYVVGGRGRVAELPLWEPHYGLWRVDGKAVGVVNELSGERLRFGAHRVFGGGSAGEEADSLAESPIPPACKGPRAYTWF